MNKALEQRAIHELKEYAFNTVYLASVFSAMLWDRRLLLMTYGVHYEEYGFAVIQAVILAKVIMIGNLMHLGRGFENKPLIVPTIYKTFVFTIYVAIFSFLEHTVRGMFHGEGWTGGVRHIKEVGVNTFMANVLVVLVTFIPFFGIKELS